MEDPEETSGRRVMIQTQIRFNQIPERSSLFSFSQLFVITISPFYYLYGTIAGIYPVKTHLLSFLLCLLPF
jgi:hypothetical protein